MVSGSISPSCSEYFSPFPHGTGSLSVSQEYLALPDGAGRFRQDFTGPALLRIPGKYQINFTYRTVTFYGPTFQLCSAINLKSIMWSYNPNKAVTLLVWANPRSLATTCGITLVFSSYGYLDVSVPHVHLPPKWDNTSSMCWVAPFGHLRINSYLPIPVDFRSLSRPSSPLRA